MLGVENGLTKAGFSRTDDGDASYHVSGYGSPVSACNQSVTRMERKEESVPWEHIGFEALQASRDTVRRQVQTQANSSDHTTTAGSDSTSTD